MKPDIRFHQLHSYGQLSPRQAFPPRFERHPFDSLYEQLTIKISQKTESHNSSWEVEIPTVRAKEHHSRLNPTPWLRTFKLCTLPSSGHTSTHRRMISFANSGSMLPFHSLSIRQPPKTMPP